MTLNMDTTKFNEMSYRILILMAATALGINAVVERTQPANSQQASLPLPGFPTYSASSVSTSEQLRSITKRVGLPQSHLKTMARVRSPCAGDHVLNHRAAADIIPPPGSVPAFSTRELLMSLHGEILITEQLIRGVLRMYEDTGVAGLVGIHYQGQLASFSRLEQLPVSNSASRANVGQFLNVLDIELARTAVVLQGLIDESMSPFAGMMTNVKEYGIYNLLCGVSILVDAEDIQRTRTAGEVAGNARLRPEFNIARRFMRDYIVLQRIGGFLRDASRRMVNLARHL